MNRQERRHMKTIKVDPSKGTAGLPKEVQEAIATQQAQEAAQREAFNAWRDAMVEVLNGGKTVSLGAKRSFLQNIIYEMDMQMMEHIAKNAVREILLLDEKAPGPSDPADNAPPNDLASEDTHSDHIVADEDSSPVLD
jgi:hypothetical protein